MTKKQVRACIEKRKKNLFSKQLVDAGVPVMKGVQEVMPNGKYSGTAIAYGK
ncbi:hypothetical protein [Xanthobacter variabilis]|uniref:hypothetical protein n=1 Tax=Xanthobacter variabilis TaxID=3119932 RepID=UPI00372BC3EB